MAKLSGKEAKRAEKRLIRSAIADLSGKSYFGNKPKKDKKKFKPEWYGSPFTRTVVTKEDLGPDDSEDSDYMCVVGIGPGRPNE